MPELSSADHFSSSPVLEIPRDYNAAHDLIARNLESGRQDQVAFIDDSQSITYGELARRVDRFASGLLASGVEPEDRIMLCMLDTIDWPTVFLGAIKAGVVPVCVNTHADAGRLRLHAAGLPRQGAVRFARTVSGVRRPAQCRYRR